METAHIRDAVSTQKFWFRKNPFPTHKPSNGTGTSTPAENPSGPATPTGSVEDEYEKMTINEVINGQQACSGNAGFPGLIPIVESYLNSMNVDVETRCDLATYLDLIRKRANGTYWTAAKWIRNFVQSHPAYQKDSVVNDEITYDLVKAAEQITKQEGRDGLGKEMLGKRR